jgi:hypothetical protein
VRSVAVGAGWVPEYAVRRDGCDAASNQVVEHGGHGFNRTGHSKILTYRFRAQVEHQRDLGQTGMSIDRDRPTVDVSYLCPGWVEVDDIMALVA